MNRYEDKEMQDQAAKISQVAKFIAPFKISVANFNSRFPNQLLLQNRTPKFMDLSTRK